MKKWCHTTSPRNKQFKIVPSAAEIMVTVYWDDKGVSPMYIFLLGTLNFDHYIETMTSLNVHLCDVCATRRMSEVLLLIENARPLTCMHTTEAITNFR
jgi:hypothetical protein